MIQQLFCNEQINESYKSIGAVKVPFVDKEDIAKLRQLFVEYCPKAAHGGGEVFYSMFSNSTDRNLELKNRIREILEPAYRKIFVNFQTFFEMFLVKQPDKNPLLLHQDWSYAEEKEVLSATVWLPLQNTTKQNGALFFIPRTHRLFDNYRSGSLPSARVPLTETVEKKVTTMETNEGEAIIFHQALFHGSHPNLSTDDRITVASVVLPAGICPQYFQYDQDTQKLSSYELSEHQFFEHLPMLSKGKIFIGAKLLGAKAYVCPQFTEQKLSQVIELEAKYAF